jgi:hypothetical protein
MAAAPKESYDKIRKKSEIQSFYRAKATNCTYSLRVLLQPVHSLGQTLERRSGGMDAVVTSVRAGSKAVLLPGGIEGTTERVSRGRGRISRTQDLATEVRPGQQLGVELDDVVVNGDGGVHELLTHFHEESVEGEQGRKTLTVDLTAVESTTELDLLGTSPQSVKSGSINVELLGGIKSIEHTALGQSLAPGETEVGLELLDRDRDLLRLQQGGLGSDGVVVLINELTLVNLRTSEITFLKDGDATSTKGISNVLLNLGVVSMRLDEDESRVLDTGHFYSTKSLRT